MTTPAESSWTPEATLTFATALLALLGSFAANMLALWSRYKTGQQVQQAVEPIKAQVQQNTQESTAALVQAQANASRLTDHAARLTAMPNLVLNHVVATAAARQRAQQQQQQQANHQSATAAASTASATGFTKPAAGASPAPADDPAIPYPGTPGAGVPRPADAGAAAAAADAGATSANDGVRARPLFSPAPPPPAYRPLSHPTGVPRQ